MDRPDFDDWVAQRGAALLRFAYLVTRDHGRAEEAVQDALLSTYSRWKRATLPTKQRAAVVLRYYEDLPDADIAVILGCSPATVRSQIHRALASLRETLTEEVNR
ncbi:hypothetical protein HPO96_21545 [Kribbella sandramycini]|uniref:DNA-directed RNA polymerase specialized sigma24 family protein n=1 Tax=Kribbella sandramycini TaxID=60450 RepID=A0A7Y4L1W7_9ACTN|nr:sigma factor-like helix-turn-helix DNA-binding protein [Kribbella sandramycini]MBB6566509.1 DNA-directed RNA polymerase specialized sigma24 family protein [Kribbella sandramycini]NOL42834.1 hypothetical protein [Kribbella sandramycini]